MDHIRVSFTLATGLGINKRVSQSTWNCKSGIIYAWFAKGISVWISIIAISMAIPPWGSLSLRIGIDSRY
jgi:hypothetical protein